MSTCSHLSLPWPFGYEMNRSLSHVKSVICESGYTFSGNGNCTYKCSTKKVFVMVDGDAWLQGRPLARLLGEFSFVLLRCSAVNIIFSGLYLYKVGLL